MTGVGDANFVISACQAGVLGSLGVGMMVPDDIDRQITAIKQATHQPFNVNLMVLDEADSG